MADYLSETGEIDSWFTYTALDPPVGLIAIIEDRDLGAPIRFRAPEVQLIDNRFEAVARLRARTIQIRKDRDLDAPIRFNFRRPG